MSDAPFFFLQAAQERPHRDPKGASKMMNLKQTMKRMVLTATAVTVMVSLAAPAAGAQEEVLVRDHRDGGGEAAPIVRDHHDDSTSTVKAEEEPYKEPGSRQCDITPVECEDAEDQQEEEGPYEDPDDNSQCFIKPYCEDTEESGDSVVVRDHRDGVGSKDEDAASAPGGVKVGENNPSAAAMKEEAVNASTDEAGRMANSDPGVYGCPYDYEYFELYDTCGPPVGSWGFFDVLNGTKEWPDSVGGNVALPGHTVADMTIAPGAAVAGIGNWIEDALVWYGEDFGIAGWPFLGIGYTVGFAGDVAGAIVQEAGELVGAVSEGVGDAIDAIGDAAGDAWDEISS